MDDATEVRPGRYQHFKGNLYEVVGVARHSETMAELVIYRALYENEFGIGSLWVRPKEMFLEQVMHDGQMSPRFRYLGPAE